MIDGIENAVKKIVRASAGIEDVKRYRNEFSSNGEWLPVFPVALIRLESMIVGGTDTGGGILWREGDMLIYVGGKISESDVVEKNVYALVEKIMEGIVKSAVIGVSDGIGGEKYLSLAIKELSFVESEFGIEIYALRIGFHLS